MKSKTPFSANEIRTGFLVIACLATLLGLLFMSSSSMLFQTTYPLHIRFNYISGLKVSAPVHYAGHEIGKVTGIRFTPEGSPKVRVSVEVRDGVKIESDSEAFINIMGFMGETYIEISSGSSSTYLKPEETITGTDPVPMMEVVKRATEIAEEFDKLAKSMNNMVQNLDGLVGENEEEMNQIFKNLDATSENLKYMTGDLKDHPWKLLRKGDEQ